jgi:2-dehydropantoate 2-reductase
MDDTPILLIGTGAMASLFAALLSAHGFRVRMLGSWGENIQAINDYGVRFINHEGHEASYKVEVTDDPRTCKKCRLAIVLVKSYQTHIAAERLGACLPDDGIALTLQNGLGNYEVLAEKLGAERVISGITTFGATLINPGRVRIGGLGSITIGEHEKAQLLVSILTQAGFVVEIVQDTRSLLWGKLIINSSINPLTALLEVKNGELLENAYALELLNLITVESASVATELGFELPYSDPLEMVKSVAQKTAQNYSSMYIDLRRGSPTEIDAINGAIVREAQNVNFPTYYNKLIWLLLKARTNSSQFSRLQINQGNSL